MLAPEVQYHGDIRYIDLRRELLYVEPSSHCEIGIMRLSALSLRLGSCAGSANPITGLLLSALPQSG